MTLELLRPVSKEWEISSPFGKRRLINGVLSKPHKGIDFACPVGTPIMACTDGKIIRSGWENPAVPKQGFGMRIMQQFKLDGVMYFLFYGHCNKLLVNEGDSVQVGQLIAESGNTGSSTGPHLHIGVRKADTQEFFDVDFIEKEDI